MLSRWVRTWYSRLLQPFLLLLAGFGVTPTMLTISSLLLILVSGFVLSQNHLIIGGIFLLLGGLLDGIDGELARVTNRTTKFGAFLDSICDHSGDFALSLGLLWLYLRASTEVVLIFAALFGSMLGSLVRSRAGMVGIETKDVGLVTRFERILILLIGLFTHRITVALWILAVLNNLAVLQRVIYVLRVSLLQKRESVVE
ncbi:MAG TPA: CDP-alcohol phosphatidyltransferase family protein [Ktedonobacteraceae bacterium]|nr:CDP-alcohol phosphatidyltransferase family protein [Ktedonobacteraceae bacterium]